MKNLSIYVLKFFHKSSLKILILRLKNTYKKAYKLIKTVHEITAGHRSLSDRNSCVTDRICFLPVTMTGRFSNFNSLSYTKDWYKLQLNGTKCGLPDTMSGTG